MIRVLVNGALGRMSSEVCKKVYSEADLELVGAVDIKEGLVALGDGVKVTTDLLAAINETKPDVVVDFTRPDVVMGSLRKMLPLGVHVVVGTTGFSNDDLKADARCESSCPRSLHHGHRPSSPSRSDCPAA